MHGIKSRSWDDRMLRIIVLITTIIVLFVCAYPVYLAVILAFNDGTDAASGGIYFWVREFTTDNFAKLMTDLTWVKATGISIATTVVGTVVTVLVTALTAYGLSNTNLIGRPVYYKIFVFSMYVSAGVIPFFAVLRILGLSNTFWVYILPSAVNIMYVFIGVAHFQSIPASLMEAARLDGAGEVTIFAKIVLPMAKPYLATVAIFSAVTHWNDWYTSAFFVQSEDLRNLAYRMYAVTSQATADVGNAGAAGAALALANTTTSLSVRLAALVIAIAPIVCVYPFFQKYIVSGATLGAVKE